jgi:nucleolar protein 15
MASVKVITFKYVFDQSRRHTDNSCLLAAGDAAPVSLKKQKPAKATAATKTATKGSKPKAAATKKESAAKKEVAAEPEEESAEPEEDPAEEQEEKDDEAQVLATELDSEDEDEDDAAGGGTLFEQGQDVGKIPEVSKQVKDAAGSSSDETGVIYIGRIPHGFYEHEMRQYFSQFGPIKRLRLSRNKKTGASKHFAFVEFEEQSTAEIVCKTMDNYLLFGHILKCQFVPKGKVHEDLFKGANRRFKKVPWNKMAGKKLEKPLTESAWKTKVDREKSKREKQAEKLKAMGYDFEAPELKSVPAPPPAEAEEETKAIEAPAAAEEANNGESSADKKKPSKATSPKTTKAKKAKA